MCFPLGNVAADCVYPSMQKLCLRHLVRLRVVHIPLPELRMLNGNFEEVASRNGVKRQFYEPCEAKSQCHKFAKLSLGQHLVGLLPNKQRPLTLVWSHEDIPP